MVKKYVFGPVASRRLGVSLGVDLVTPKTCSLNCVYCEARETTLLTLERKEYVPVDRVLEELDEVLKEQPEIDYVTFSGSGEPTLNSRIGDVVTFLKSRYPQYKICLLTNGLALGDKKLQQDISQVDLLIPSLDASNGEEFEAVNRPAPGMTFDRFITDLTEYVAKAPMRVDLELFILPGVNDSDASVERFKKLIAVMKPDRVQLNTLDRPGAVDGLRSADAATVRRFISALEPVVPVEAVGKFRYRTPSPGNKILPATELEARIMEFISRRPATLPDLALALDMPEEELQKLMDWLFECGKIGTAREERGVFYLPMGGK